MTEPAEPLSDEELEEHRSAPFLQDYRPTKPLGRWLATIDALKAENERLTAERDLLRQELEDTKLALTLLNGRLYSAQKEIEDCVRHEMEQHQAEIERLEDAELFDHEESRHD